MLLWINLGLEEVKQMIRLITKEVFWRARPG